MAQVTRERPAQQTASWRLPTLWLSAVALLALLWLAGVLVPYYVNGLDRLSTSELTSGAWDPAQLWPADAGVLGRTVQVAGAFVGWPLMDVVHLPSMLGSAYLLKQEWSTSSRGERALLVALTTLSAALTGLLLSPFGIALSTWALD